MLENREKPGLALKDRGGHAVNDSSREICVTPKKKTSDDKKVCYRQSGKTVPTFYGYEKVRSSMHQLKKGDSFVTASTAMSSAIGFGGESSYKTSGSSIAIQAKKPISYFYGRSS